MPTSVIHEIVAKKITTSNKMLDNYNFYLGCVAPDAVNFSGFAYREMRWKSNLRDKNLQVWKRNVLNFYIKNKNKYEESFIKGYVVHIFTDIIYDEKFYDIVVNPMKEINLVNHEAHLYMLEEMDAYGNNNLDYQYVIDKLKSLDINYQIINISKEQLNDWKNKVISKNLPTIKVKYITENIIDELTKEVIKQLIENRII